METRIEVEFKKEIISGILLKEDETYITVKLESGYNSILNKKNSKILKKEELKLKSKSIFSKKQKNSKLNKIMILHTGGTIASKVDYKTGAVSSKFTPEELLNLYPSLNEKADLHVKMIGNLFSEDMRFDHYNLMLEEIKLAVENECCGVIISHGTDTLHYTSAALEYSLENLSIPVIIVGAQRSSDRPSSDAYSNLNAAIDFIINNNSQNLKFNRVGVCMHKNISDDSFLILDSINLKKMHSTRRDAFKQINYLPFVKIENGNIEILRDELLSICEDKKKLSFVKYNSSIKIGFFKVHPNLFPEEISALSIYDVVIIEGTGLGHLGINEIDKVTKIHTRNLNALRELVKTTKLIMGVQTVYGEVNMDVYSTGRYLQQIGVLGNHMNLTTESLFVRSAYCLSKSMKDFNKFWNSNLEGFEFTSLKEFDVE